MGVARPDGVALPLGVILLGVALPSPTGVRLVTNTTGGDKAGEGVLGVTGVTGAVVVAGTYMGTEEMGLPRVDGGETNGGGDTGAVCDMGGTTLIGVCGLGRTTGGEGLDGTGRVEMDAVVAVLDIVILRVVLALARVGVLGADVLGPGVLGAGGWTCCILGTLW